MNWDHFVIFEITSKYCISDSFVDSERYFISSKRFLPTVVDIMVIWIKFTHSHPIYFTDSYDVNVQSCHLLLDHIQFTLIHRPKVPMQHCSLQYRTLLSPPDTSTTEHFFLFGPATSFFLEDFSALPQWHTGHLPTWEAHVLVSYLFVHSHFLWGSHGQNTGVVCHSFPQWTTSCQNSAL